MAFLIEPKRETSPISSAHVSAVIASQAVGELAGIDPVVLLLGCSNRTQHQWMCHLDLGSRRMVPEVGFAAELRDPIWRIALKSLFFGKFNLWRIGNFPKICRSLISERGMGLPARWE